MFWTAVALVAGFIALRRLISYFWTVSDLTEKHVLISGCDSGFGHLLAIKLVQNGIPTFAGCLTEKGEAELRRATSIAPGKLWTFRLDVTKQDSVNAAMQFVKEQLGDKGLWAVVNNAGILGHCVPDDWLTADCYQQTLDVNCLGVIRLTHAVKPLIKKEKGRIVVITSVFGRLALPTLGPYNVSKFAIEGYCDVLRIEMKCFGVSVHILEPGVFATKMTNPKAFATCWREMFNRQPEEIRKQYGEKYLEECIECVSRNLNNFTNRNPEIVVDSYYHALTSRLPKLRYVIGLDAWLYYIPISLMPTAIGDWILRLSMKLQNAPIPVSCRK